MEKDYFVEQDNYIVVEKINRNFNNKDKIKSYFEAQKQFYEYVPFHPVCASSEMVGTSIEELINHNYPSKRSWECSRLSDFPQEIILRLNYRSHIKYILLKSKPNRPIPELNIMVADGISDNGQTIEIDSIGNYIKFVFVKPALKNIENPFGQVSLSQFYNQQNEENKDSIDSLLISMGLPLNDPYFYVNDANYEIAPVDDETRITIKDMLEILHRSEKTKDFEILKKLKKDLKIVYELGNDILNSQRQLKIAVAKEDFDTAILLRKKIKDLQKKRDKFDALYETSRYENMIVMKRPTTAELLEEEERRLREERERRDKERLERERLERERKQRELEEKMRNDALRGGDEGFGNKGRKFNEYVPQRKKKQEEEEDEFINELVYNQGDKDLEPYFNPLARNAGGKVPTIDQSKLRKALRNGILNTTGVRVYSSMNGEDWKMREAAIKAFVEYIQNPLLPRYKNKTLPLFLSSIELCKIAVDDKVISIYLEGLKLLANCLSPPVCGNDIDPNLIQKSVSYFIPRLIKKISELNFRARDNSMMTLLSIFKHPALNVGDLIKGCMDLVERQDGLTPDKQPWSILLARLEIVLHVLEDYGIDESLWDWYPVFTELIVPGLFHPNAQCRMVSIEVCVLLYKMIGNDIRIIINDLPNLKPNLKEMINNRMNEVDNIVRRQIDSQQQNLLNKSLDISKEGNDSGLNKLATIVESNEPDLLSNY